jgi:predicted permease
VTFRSDVRFALRQLRKSPAFAFVVLTTLGLSIGVNTAIYSVLNAVLLRPAPYPQPDRLALLVTSYGRQGREGVNDAQTGALYEAVRDGVPSLEVAAWSGGGSGANFSAPGHLEYIHQQRVATGFFHVLGVAPQFGREFNRQEDTPGGPAVAVLSYEFWQRVFRGDTSVLGRGINLKGEPYTVVGIMPRGFRTSATIPAEVWTPLRPTRTGEGSGSNYQVVARLKPGVTWREATQQLQALSRGLMETPGFPREYATFEERIVPLQSGLTADVRSQLLITWAAVLAVLLIGCVNIAGLLLARSAARGREISTRMALGGGRAVIVKQLMVESLLLALGGCGAGIAIGWVALAGLKRLGAANYELWHPIEVDGPVLLAMLGIAVLTSLLFGLMPALSTSKLDIRSVLMEAGRSVAGPRRRWSRHFLVVCEVALSLVLLVSAGLLVRTLGYLNGLNPGFDTRNVISAEASLQDARYNTAAAVSLLYTRSLERIRQIPGVQSAAVALTLPYERPLNWSFRTVDGDDIHSHGVEMVYCTPAYFETLRIPLLDGRTVGDSDTADSAPAVVVSRSFADRYFQGRQAVGRRLLFNRTSREVVGVVGDVQQHSGLGNFGPLNLEPTVYVPVSQLPDGMLQVLHVWFGPKWVVRTNGAGGNVAAQIQSAVAGADPLLPIAKFQTIDDLRAKITADQRYHAALFSILAALALLLAGIGLYGLISQSVAQRSHELGIRMALGATAGQAMANAVKPGILLALAGVGAGYILSLVAVRFLEHLLFGVRTTDPATFAATASILLLVTVVASAVPALRILRLDPAKTLRAE